MATTSVNRVRRHTAPKVQRKIDRATRRNIARFRRSDRQGRIKELEREWDIERVIEANAASLALAGTLLGFFVDRRFLLLPAAVTGFLLQHAVQGWCPPVPILRRLGFRTAHEIDEERFALMRA